MTSRKDILLHRHYYTLKITQFCIFLFCIVGFLYSYFRDFVPELVQLCVILLISIAAILFFTKKEFLLFALAVSSILINLDIQFTPFWMFTRLTVVISLCVSNIISLELRYAKNNFGLTLFPPGTGTLRPNSIGNVGRLLSLWELATTMKWKKGGIFIGRPLPEQRVLGLFNSIKVGPVDDRHMLTIASSRSGKGTAVIIPNLIYYPGSVIAIDPKGELATVTGARRGFGSKYVTNFLKQKVYVFDPENLVQNHPSASWNPLKELEPNDPLVWTKIVQIASTIIPMDDGQQSDPYFTGNARAYLTALIAHVLTAEPVVNQNLIYVRKLIQEGDVEYHELLAAEDQHYDSPQAALLVYMVQNQAHSGKIARTASSFQQMPFDTRSSVITTLGEKTEFLDDPGLENSLKKSDFKLCDLKKKPTTLYICISARSLATPMVNILRIFIDGAMTAMSDKRIIKPKHPVLFVLDEFPSIGRSEQIEKSMGLMAGFGITLWPIIQNISQLKALYPQSYNTFLTNTRGIQFFGDLEIENLKYIEENSGVRIQSFPDGSTREIPMLSVSALKTDYFVRSDRRQIYLCQGRPVALLELVDYHKFISKTLYDDENSGPDSSIQLLAAPKREQLVLEPPKYDNNDNLSDSDLQEATTNTQHEKSEAFQRRSSETTYSPGGSEKFESVVLTTGFILFINPQKYFRLKLDDKLTTEDIPEIARGKSGNGTIQVERFEEAPNKFVLRNLSSDTWFVNDDFSKQLIKTGQACRLKSDLNISIGSFNMEVYYRPFLLVTSTGDISVLNKGRKLSTGDLPILTSCSKQSKVVAEVVVNPNNTTVLGLRNESTCSWNVINSSQQKCEVIPTKSVVLEDGLTVSFETETVKIML